MTNTPVAPEFDLDDCVENADWIKGGTWDLPPYCSTEFFQVIPVDRLPWFRTTVTYKAAVAKGLIYDDDWVGDYVKDPMKGFVDELYAAIKEGKTLEKRDTTFDGIVDQEYVATPLSEDEMKQNAAIMALAQKALLLPDHDDSPGLRISGRAAAATLTAVTNDDTAPSSRGADHLRAVDVNMQANSYFLNINEELAELYEEIADAHKAMADNLNAEAQVEKVAIDDAAHEAATSPRNDLEDPSDAQKDAGNYVKGHITISGVDIAIENPAGSQRKPQWPILQSHYGYIKGTTGADGDHTDCFVRVGTDDEYRGPVYVIDQMKQDGTFDEHKCLIGWTSKQAAVKAYLANYKPGWRVGNVTRFTWEKFVEWVEHGDHSGPVAEK